MGKGVPLLFRLGLLILSRTRGIAKIPADLRHDASARLRTLPLAGCRQGRSRKRTMLIDDPLPPDRKSEPTELGKPSHKRVPGRSRELGSREAVMRMGRTEKEQARVHIRS